MKKTFRMERGAGLLMLFLALFTLPTVLAAQNNVGGHFGFVLPLVTRVDGDQTTINDDFKIGFPMGITVKRPHGPAFDLEVVPVIDDTPLHVDLTIHPGLIWDLGPAAAGIRAAFDVNQASWGFTPLVAKGFPVGANGDKLFAELDLPIRFQRDAAGSNKTAVTLAAHFGWAF
jgi:hypothetical protein